ncbi:MAG: zinc-ribbon domain-containing protein [Promethearchaeota archaeon]
MVKVKYAYCKYCEKEVHKPSQKPLGSMQKNYWIVVCIATLGIGIIGYYIYKNSLKKKIYCPTCYSKLEFSYEPFEKPKLAETLTAKQKTMAKVEKKKTGKAPAKKKVEKKEMEKEPEEKKLICELCGETLEEKTKTCPYCGAPLKF